MIRTYSELIELPTFGQRFNYLKLQGEVGAQTFGWHRFENQALYNSYRWRIARRNVIARDRGCDLGVEGYELHDHIIVHHMNPLTISHVEEDDPRNYDEDQLISCSLKTHNAIHYSDEEQLPRLFAERKPGDTTLW
jgi:hypothetical protein